MLSWSTAASRPTRSSRAAKGRTSSRIVQTHGHIDHVQALAELKETSGGPRLRAPGRGLPVEIEVALADGDKVAFGNREVTVLHTPGHTPRRHLPSHRRAPRLGRHVVPGRTGKHVGRCDGVRADHRFDLLEALRISRRHRRLSGAREGHDDRQREAASPGVDRTAAGSSGRSGTTLRSVDERGGGTSRD